METCRSKEPADQLIDHIDSYLKDKDNQYAIALEGDWGSGKTRFIEGNSTSISKRANTTLSAFPCSELPLLMIYTNVL